MTVYLHNHVTFFKAYQWNGKELIHKFTVDFIDAKLGRPHQMRFGAYSLYGKVSELPGANKRAALDGTKAD